MPEPLALPNAGLEAALAAHLGEPLSFVNVGASDGVTNDPLYPFAVNYGWKGLLVEPVPHIFELLRRNYTGLPDMQFANVVVGRARGTHTFYHLPEDYCETRPWARQIGSFDLERVRWVIAYAAKTGFLPDAEIEDMDRIVGVELPCEPLPLLLARHGIERFDVLNLDAEGADLEILEDLDLDRYGVRAAVVETKPHFHDDRISILLHLRGFDRVTSIDWTSDAFVRRNLR